MLHTINGNREPTDVLVDFREDPDGHLLVEPGRWPIYPEVSWDFPAGRRSAKFVGTALLDFVDTEAVRFFGGVSGPHPQEVIGGDWRQIGAQLELVGTTNVTLRARVEWGDFIVRLEPPTHYPPPQAEMLELHVTTVLGGVYLIGAEGASSMRGMVLRARTFGPRSLVVHNADPYDSDISVLGWATRTKDGRLPFDVVCYDRVRTHGSRLRHRIEGQTAAIGSYRGLGHWQTGEPSVTETELFSLSLKHRTGIPFRFHHPETDLPAQLLFTSSKPSDHQFHWRTDDGYLP